MDNKTFWRQIWPKGKEKEEKVHISSIGKNHIFPYLDLKKLQKIRVWKEDKRLKMFQIFLFLPQSFLVKEKYDPRRGGGGAKYTYQSVFRIHIILMRIRIRIPSFGMMDPDPDPT